MSRRGFSLNCSPRLGKNMPSNCGLCKRKRAESEEWRLMLADVSGIPRRATGAGFALGPPDLWYRGCDTPPLTERLANFFSQLTVVLIGGVVMVVGIVCITWARGLAIRARDDRLRRSTPHTQTAGAPPECSVPAP